MTRLSTALPTKEKLKVVKSPGSREKVAQSIIVREAPKVTERLAVPKPTMPTLAGSAFPGNGGIEGPTGLAGTSNVSKERKIAAADVILAKYSFVFIRIKISTCYVRTRTEQARSVKPNLGLICP